MQNASPTITQLTGPLTLDEGQAGQYAATASDPGNDVLTYLWDFGDGTAAVKGSSVTHEFAASGTYDMTLNVSDGDGRTAFEYRTIEVANVAPRNVSAGGDRAAIEGDLVQMSASWNDPGGTSDEPFAFTWEVTASNGQAIAGGQARDFSFKPNDDGIYYVDLTVTDADGAAGSVRTTVTVINAAPVITSLEPNRHVLEGDVLDFAELATFADAGYVPGETFMYAIDWGDGSEPDVGSPEITSPENSPASGRVAGTHVYLDEGIYTVSISVTDDDGGSTGGSITIAVTNAAPQLTLSAPEAAEMLSGTMYSGTVSDVAGDELSAEIVFGDGVRVPVSLVPQGNGGPTVDYAFQVSHYFSEPGVYDATFNVTDHDGGVTSRAAVVHVGPPIVSAVLRNDGLDRSDQLSSLSLTFSDDVAATVAVGDLTLYNNSTGEFVDLSGMTSSDFSYDPQTHTARWDLSGLSLGEAFYSASIPGGQVADQFGRLLDGNADGTGGDDYLNVIVVAMPGDANADGQVNIADLRSVISGFGSATPGWSDGDFNSDGVVDGADYITVKQRYGDSLSFTPMPAPVAAMSIESAPLVIAPTTTQDAPAADGLTALAEQAAASALLTADALDAARPQDTRPGQASRRRQKSATLHRLPTPRPNPR